MKVTNKEIVTDAHYLSFVQGIRWWPGDSHHKGFIMREGFSNHQIASMMAVDIVLWYFIIDE